MSVCIQTSAKVGVEAGVDERVERAVGEGQVVGKPEEAMIPVWELRTHHITQTTYENDGRVR